AKHALVDGEYAQRQQQCQAAAKHFGVKALRDVAEPQLESAKGHLAETTLRRARHVVTEIARVEKFAEALRGRDYAKAGELMYASHDSLKRDYEVSTQEL